MLTRFHKILLAVLAVQVVLAVIVLVRGSDSGALKEHPLVPGFDAAKVTRLQVFTSETAKPIDLVKRDASWVLASGFDYPADQTKVNDVLTPITKIAAAAPIASQSSRHKQLKVDKSDYERKLVITADGKDLVLYLGAAAGARRTAVRLGTEDKVYAVTGISAFTAGSEPRQWIDTSYVKIPRDDVARLVVKRESGTMELARSVPPPPAAGSAGSGSAGGAEGSGSAGSAAPPPGPPAAEHWTAAIGGTPITLAAGETIDESAIDRLVSEVTTLDMNAPADPKRDASRPTATITIERKASGSTAPAPTVLDVIADGNSFWVHDRSLSRAAMVDKSRLDELIGADRDKLIKKPPPPPAPMPGAGSGSAAKPPGAPGAAGSAAKPPVPTPPGGPGPGAAAKQPAPTPPGAAAKQPTAPPPSARPATGSAGR
ncbi:MAG: DUF4340 domain-containing protein [Deltaproteobacteria bacterium]|nr:MAG: DUF4340 domain-containing protein [Deltaproteobacteria bacterium]